MSSTLRSRSKECRGKRVLITGGAGFIGTNLADRLLRDGERVILFDNLSRSGVERNYEWLKHEHGDAVTLQFADITDEGAVAHAVRQASAVFHFAAQVAVTTSLQNPTHDFEVNARGTLNVLNALRGLSQAPPLVFTSTNKVYGSLADVSLRIVNGRYEPDDLQLCVQGVDEERRLDFDSPYGCSKGSADQYVLDHARNFGLPAVVFRMSCIYGPHQCGTEDQGWVAHFIKQAQAQAPLLIYGNGKQVRDILFVTDLVDAFLRARKGMDQLRGNAFNIGGGAKNTVSLIELLDLLESLNGARPHTSFSMWRVGDQRYYVSDTRKFSSMTGWRPTVSAKEGVRKLHEWLLQNRTTEPAAMAQLA